MFKGLFSRDPSPDPTHHWLGDIAELVQAFGNEPRETRDGFDFDVGPARTSVSHRREDHVCQDGRRIICRYDVVTQVSSELLPPVTSSDAATSVLNTRAALSALTYDPDARMLALRSRISVHADDDEERLFVGLIAMSAVSGANVLAEMLAVVTGDNLPRHPGLFATEPCQWNATDFAEAADGMRKRGLLANGDTGGLTVEFPWDARAVSWAAGAGRTSLLQLLPTQVHPVLGGGLFVKLDLPLSFEAGDAQRLAALLNWREVREVDAPPLLGAWCSPPNSGDLVFVAFLPNSLHASPGVATLLSTWMGIRAMTVAKVLSDLA